MVWFLLYLSSGVSFFVFLGGLVPWVLLVFRVDAVAIFVVPPDPLSFVPFPHFDFSLSIFELALAMLLPVLPGTLVDSSIWPFQGALSLLLVFKVLAHVLTAISPCEFTATVHLIILPGTFVAPLISPFVLSKATDIVELKLAIVTRSICPGKLACPVLRSIHEISLILRLIRPSLRAFAVLLVLKPVTPIDGPI